MGHLAWEHNPGGTEANPMNAEVSRLAPAAAGAIGKAAADCGMAGIRRGAAAMPVIMSFAAILVVWLSIGFHLRQERTQYERGAEQDSGNLARGFGENINRTIEGVEQIIKLLRIAFARDPAGFDLARLAPADLILDDLTLQIAATDTAGMMTMSNLPFTSRVDLSDREHIRVQLQSTADQLFISKPVLGRVSKKWSIQFSRKLFTADGTFAGVIVVSLDPSYLSRFYESLEIGRGSILLAGLDDAVIRVRAPSLDNAIGGTLGPDTMKLLRDGPVNGTFELASRLDGVDRIFSYRRLDKHRFAVIVGLASAEVFANYRRDQFTYLMAGAVMTLLITFAGLAVIRQRFRLLTSQARLTATLENISQGIIMIDENDQVPVINRRAMELLDLPRQLMRDGVRFREILDWQLTTGEFEAQAASIDVGTLASGAGIGPDHYERTRPNGTVLEIRTQQLSSGGAVRTFTDITEQKQAARALAEARDTAEAASRARSNFLATMSHEIRTPLNGVIGMAGLLLDSPLRPAQRTFAETLRDAAGDLLRIINDILDFSKLEADRLEFEDIPFSPEQVIVSVVDLMQVKAMEKGLAIWVRVAPGIPPWLSGDAGRLRLVLLNLVGNALKFTEIGTVSIEADLIALENGKARVGFQVIDTGIGIDREAQSLLFQQFSQVDSSISRRFGGTGLGLAISRRLVEHMGGTIGVKSAVGEGATFHFDINLRVATPPPARTTPDRFDAQPPERRLRILLAEDNATNRLVAVTRLEMMGHRVDAVADGQEAVTAARDVPYDLILMDVMMPGMDGMTATRAIRDLPGPVSEIPIVAMTANVFKQHELDCVAAGMDGFLGKPLIVGELASIIDRAIAGTLRTGSTRPKDPGGASAFQRLARDFGPDMAASLLATFAEEANARIAAMREKIAAADWEGLAREARALRAAAETVGLSAVSHRAGQLGQETTAAAAEAGLRDLAEEVAHTGGDLTPQGD
jgi:signal transduction histidine kinase/DNA-binding NarL/FixJ family response regulator